MCTLRVSTFMTKDNKKIYKINNNHKRRNVLMKCDTSSERLWIPSPLSECTSLGQNGSACFSYLWSSYWRLCSLAVVKLRVQVLRRWVKETPEVGREASSGGKVASLGPSWSPRVAMFTPPATPFTHIPRPPSLPQFTSLCCHEQLHNHTPHYVSIMMGCKAVESCREMCVSP